MTIKFYCPNCDALIAFDSKHAGKRAHCTTCGQAFIIPAKDNEIPKKIKPPSEIVEPIPGFYRAVFVDTWKIFAIPKKITPLVFVAAVVCFKFFLGHLDYTIETPGFNIIIPVGWASKIIVWGCLFWYYTEIINATAFDADELPEAYMGGLFGFVWLVIKSVYLFALTLVVVEMPCIVTIMVLRKIGVDLPLLVYILATAGLFAFPMAILTIAIGKDPTMLFRPDYILRPIARAFCPYFIVASLIILAAFLQLKTLEFGDLPRVTASIAGLHLFTNIAVQFLILIAIRSIGLFHRHYSCYLPW